MSGYSWTGPDTYANGTQSPTVSGAATVTMDGIYTIVVTDGNGCTDSETTDITVNALPTASISGTATFCFSVGTTLTASGGTSYLWITGDNVAIISKNPVASTSYTVTTTDGNGCTDEETIAVTVNSLPVATASGNSPVCVNGTLTLTGGPGAMTTYLWSGPGAYSDNTQSPTVSASATLAMDGLYTITVTDGNNCTDEASVDVTVNALPVATAAGNSPVCAGSTLTLTSGPGAMSGYSWTGPDTYADGAQSPTVSGAATVAMDGIYTIVVTDGNGCTDSETTNVIVNTLPIASISGDNSICFGGTASMTATGGISYLWSTGSNAVSISKSPIADSTFAVTVTDINICSDSANFEVIVYPLPVAGIVGEVEVCFGETVNLTASGGVTYQWNTTDTDASISDVPAVTTVYSVTATDGNSCSDQESITTVVNSLPVVAITGTSTICEGDSIVLTSSAGTSYVWSTAATTMSIIETPAVDTTYQVIVTNTDGCIDSNDIDITVNELPVADITGEAVICNGDTATLTASGGIDFLWSNGKTTASIDVNPNTSTTYTVTVSNADGCTDTESHFVTVNPLPVAGIVGETVLCLGDSAILTAAGGLTYLWNTPSTDHEIVVTPLVTSTFVVSVTDLNGCLQISEIDITVNDLPITSLGGDTSLCAGDNTTLTATGGSSYLWNTGASSPSITEMPGVTTQYEITVTNTAGCTVSENTSVSVYSLPTVAISGENDLCIGESTVLTGNGGFTYLWNNATTSSSITVTPGVTTIYSVTTTDVHGCTDIENISVNVHLLPAAGITGDNIICRGENTILNASGGTAYLWSNSSTSQSLLIAPDSTKIYSVTVTNINGCTDTESITVTVNSLPVVSLSADTEICFGESTTITATGGEAYQWSQGSITPVISTSPALTSAYSVTATNGLGCQVVSTISINVNALPVVDALATDDEICKGDSEVLTGSGAATYAWSNGVINGVPFSPLLTNIYFVTGTDINGCKNSDQIMVTVNTLPNVDMGEDSTLCLNDTITLDAGFFVGYQWSNTSTTRTIKVSNSGTYVVTVTNAKGCTDVDDILIEDAIPLNITASILDVICNLGSNGEINITLNGGESPYLYQWAHGATTQDLYYLGAGAYSVTAIDNNECSISISSTVNEPDALVVSEVLTQAGCGLSNGAIDVTLSGGTLPYELIWSTGETTLAIDSLAAAGYTLTVTDSSGCVETQMYGISNFGKPDIDSVYKANVSCFGGNNGGSIVHASGGTLPYSYIWSNGSSVDYIDGVIAGTYIVTISDSIGCIEMGVVKITQPNALVSAVTAHDVSCFEAFDGSASISISGGTFPYITNWSTAETTASIESLDNGAYQVTVTDFNNCVSYNDFVIFQPDSFISSIIDSSVSCFGLSDGIATLLLAGGTSPYNIVWSDGGIHNDNIGLSAGYYYVTATDVNNCLVSDSVEITEPILLTTDISYGDVTCNGQNNGFAELMVEGGTLPYSILWSEGSTTNGITGLIPGFYSVSITDENECFTLASVDISEPTPLFSTVFGTDVSCYGQADGSADLIISGGAIPYSVDWSSGETNFTITDLSAGMYFATITDANTCTSEEAIEIDEPDTLTVNLSGVDVGCFGQNQGSALATINGGTTPYSILWTYGETTNFISDLYSGFYDVRIVDANNCSVQDTLEIKENDALTTEITAVNLTCNSDHSGSIDLEVSGGIAPYYYQWSNGATTQDLSGKNAGMYYVTVVDSNACFTNNFIEITQPAVITLNANVVIATCGENNGQIDISVSGGSGPYMSIWSTGDTALSINDLVSGAYTITVTDNMGCTKSNSYSISNTGKPDFDSVIVVDASCYGESTGSIDVFVSGGILPYDFNWSTGDSLFNITSLSANEYIVTVTDSIGCFEILAIEIVEPDAISTLTHGNNTACFGDSSGTAQIVVEGGIPSYSVLWTNAATDLNISGLAAGNYSVTVTDFNGCTVTDSVGIAEPLLLSSICTGIDPLCFSENEGSVDLTVSGGTLPYHYLWSNLASSQDLSGVAAGEYTVTITDGKGCSTTNVFTITNPDELIVSETITDAACGLNDGSISIIISGGVFPFNYVWSNGITDLLNDSLPAGTYMVTIVDSNSCVSNFEYGISNFGAPVINATTITDLSCYGDSSGGISLSISSGISPYLFSWSNGASSQDITGLTAGTYIVTVASDDGCLTVKSGIIVKEPTLLEDTILVSDVSCTGFADGYLTVASSGGTSPYSFQWSTGGTSLVIHNLEVGAYSVTVTDDHSCTRVDVASIIEPTQLTASMMSSDAICFGQNSGTAVVTAVGGTQPYLYLWSTGASTADISGLVAGSYYTTVSDNNGCMSLDTAIIGQPTLLVGTVSSVAVTCYSGSDGSALVSASGGVPPYNYFWSTWDTMSTLLNIPSQSYSVSITDANYCSLSKVVTVGSPSLIEIFDTLMLCEGDSILYHGTYMDSSGVYSDTLISMSGCDSINTFVLLMQSSYLAEEFDTVCYGTNYVWRDSTFTASGIFSNEFITVAGCDSIYRLNLVVNPSYDIADTIKICVGDSVFASGQWNFVSGTYIDNFTTNAGCDSNIVTELIVTDSIVNNVLVEICIGDSIFVGGAYQATSGVYLDFFTAVFGCDSTVVTELVVYESIVTLDTIAVCQGDSVFIGGAYQTLSGTYADAFSTALGCDSTVLTHLMLIPEYDIFDTVQLCNGDSILTGGEWQTSAGIFSSTFTSVLGCDSTVTLVLIFTDSIVIHSVVDICLGDSMFVGGAWQTTGGTYTDFGTAEAGCDSTVITTLTIRPIYVVDDTTTICVGDSVFLGGGWQTSAGWFIDTLSSEFGCDSIVSTLLEFEIITANAGSDVDYITSSSGELIGSTAISGLSYLWIPSTGLNYDNIAQPVASPMDTQTYILFVTSEMGCSSTDTVIVSVKDCNPVIDSVQSGSACGSGSIDLMAFATGLISWFDSAVGGIVLDTGAVFTTDTLSFSTIYYVETEDDGCTSERIPIEANVFDFPVALASTEDATICHDSLLTLYGAGGDSYFWSGPNNFTSILQNPLVSDTNDVSGTYYLTAVDTNNCNDIDSVVINIGSELVILFNEQSEELSVSGGIPEYTYSWSNGSNTQTVDDLSEGIYTLTVTDDYQCISTHLITIHMDIVSAFSPNNDGVNETWIIQKLNKYPGTTLAIYNRWGSLIYNNPHEPWDGTYKGRKVPYGPYMYVIDLNDGSPVLKGTVTVIY